MRLVTAFRCRLGTFYIVSILLITSGIGFSDFRFQGAVVGNGCTALAQSEDNKVTSVVSHNASSDQTVFEIKLNEQLNEPTDIELIAAQAGPITRGATRVLRMLSRIQKRLKTTRYQHHTVVREWKGLYAWDCSGMTEWILKRVAPRTLKGISKRRPVARDFFRRIENSPTNRARRGFRRLSKLSDAMPGDVFAWLRPPEWGPGASGHVGFILQTPQPVTGVPYAYRVRIADATSLPHQNDTRHGSEKGGFGIGTIIFRTDPHGVGTHYGWFGTSIKSKSAKPESCWRRYLQTGSR